MGGKKGKRDEYFVNSLIHESKGFTTCVFIGGIRLMKSHEKMKMKKHIGK